MATATLTLNCWIRSTTATEIFSVDILKTATVAGLQKMIKTQREVTSPADKLHLYKVSVSKPHENGLRTLTLSEHGEPLSPLDELSEVFPAQPSERSIHVIVDAPSSINCYLRTARNGSLSIPIQPGHSVDKFTSFMASQLDVAITSIRLYRISGEENQLKDKIGSGKPLLGGDLASHFLGVPVLEPLWVVVEVLVDTPPLDQATFPIPQGADLDQYKGIAIKVQSWKRFVSSDIPGNRVQDVGNASIPPFVMTFERKLATKPRLPSNSVELNALEIPRRYFGLAEGSTAGDISQEQVRQADVPEVIHTYYLTSREWQRRWRSDGGSNNPFKERSANSMFFDSLLIADTSTIVVQQNKECPVTVVVKCEQELRQDTPRSDFLISKSTLPRLLIEVNSTPVNDWPPDLIRMLLTGAFIVRFANKFVSTFQKKDFVLCAAFIWPDGTVDLYTLFQKTDEKVYYKRAQLYLHDPDHRAEFARYLYNLLHEKPNNEEDKVARTATGALNAAIEARGLKSMHSKNPNPQGSKKRSHGDDNHDDSAGEGGGGRRRLRAHGYEVKPKVIVDEDGGEWESLCKTPDHVLTVYRPSKSSEEYIAKKLFGKPNELEIFKLLDAIPVKSDHVISLVDSFDGWAILPKMVTVQDYVEYRVIPDTFETKISEVSRGLIEGLAYLHEHRIAHRDIKPDNLVVDGSFNLKIIDFDIAMRVKDEDEEVDEQCGTGGWMAPELEKKLRHSPIKADRWACGKVILFLLERFRKEDESLRAFARDLVAYDPSERPSLREWGRYSTLPFSDRRDIGNADAREATQLRRDRVEADGENTEAPNAKRPRLQSGQYDTSEIQDCRGLGIFVPPTEVY